MTILKICNLSKLLFCIFIFSLAHLAAFSQGVSEQRNSRSIEAIRTSISPQIDGTIDQVFLDVEKKAVDFTTLDPVPGLPSEFPTEVSVVYDDLAIYIAAKLYDDDIKSMIKDLSPRDQATNTDFFGVTFDPYKTGLSGFSFVVTAAGVQMDVKETEEDSDQSWNDVWASSVSIVDDGWIVEMAIPYSALRFPTEEVNDWNLQFIRVVRKTRERSFWNPVDPALNNFLTQMGSLKNISNIEAPLRLSVTPYIGTQLNTVPNGNDINLSPRMSGGMDVKYGINEAFTLDMILIPDFSQVRSDVQVLNLTPFEIRFDENRPFFTEGLELFNTAGIFYTRRIGGPGFLRNELLNDPEIQAISSLPNSNLVNATKISGRTNTNTGIGFFNAVEAPTYATVVDTNFQEQRRLVNPLTNYNVVVVEQALKNNSSISLINTNTLRSGSSRDANVTAISWALRNNKQTYDTRGNFKSSQIFEGEKPELGFSYNLNAGKIAGKWQYRLFHYVESVNYDINDLGFLFSANESGYFASLNYNEFKPKNDKLAFWRLGAGVSYDQLYAPREFTGMYVSVDGFLKFKSFDAFGLDVGVAPLGEHDYFEPRTGDFSIFLMNEPLTYIGGFVSSDYRKPLAVDVRFGAAKIAFKDRYQGDLSVAPRIRVNSQIFIVPRVGYSHTNIDRGYVFYGNLDIPDLTFGEDILIGARNVYEFNNSLTVQYNITDKMSLNVEANHYFSSVDYQYFNVLLDDGSLRQIDYDGLDENGMKRHDRNYNFFTVNAVFTWRFAPGSDLILSYKSNLTQFTDDQSYIDNLSILGDFYKFSGLNLKALYFLDVNKLRQISKNGK